MAPEFLDLGSAGDGSRPKAILIDVIVDDLTELADGSLQESRWLGRRGGVYSYEEAVCGVIDDSGLGDVLDRPDPMAYLPQSAARAFDNSWRAFQRLNSKSHGMPTSVF